MSIIYKINTAITSEQFIGLLQSSSLAKRRPIDDIHCMQGMLANSNLIVSAWHDDTLIGIARSVTDFHYCCYLADLAVSKHYQHQGIGKNLQKLTQQQLGAKCKIILIAAPDASDYYRYIGFSQNQRCWVLTAQQEII